MVAAWQLARHGSAKQVEVALRGLRRAFRGVWALGDPDELGWFMAAALAMGPSGAVSHSSALMLLGLRPYEAGDIHVTHAGGGRTSREGLIPHRRAAPDVGLCRGIPVTSPTQSLWDADLEPHELYRALEEAEKRGYPTSLPLGDVVRLKQRVEGYTRSDAEARALLLMADDGIELPKVNHHVNGIEADFHWPAHRVVLEVDGWSSTESARSSRRTAAAAWCTRRRAGASPGPAPARCATSRSWCSPRSVG